MVAKKSSKKKSSKKKTTKKSSKKKNTKKTSNKKKSTGKKKTSVFKKVASAVKKTVKKVAKTVKNAVKHPVKTAKKVASAVKKTVSRAASAVKKLFSKKSGKSSSKGNSASKNTSGKLRYGDSLFDLIGHKKKKTDPADRFIGVYESWEGYSESNGGNRKIADIYNNKCKPLARDYPLKYTDDWCDATFSAAAAVAGLTDLVGSEVSVPKHVQIFQDKGIWIGKTSSPKPGDAIVYDMNNNGGEDHIGVVKNVSGNIITTIEGNYEDAVKERTIKTDDERIIGYARPHYEEAACNTSINGQPVESIIESTLPNTDFTSWEDGDNQDGALTVYQNTDWELFFNGGSDE